MATKELATREDTVEVAVEELKESRVADDNAAVQLDTTALVNGERHPTTIEVAQEDLPAIAVALLNPSTPDAPAPAPAPVPDALPVALWCLAAGVIEDASKKGVRIHLQFESGQVLPVEMSIDAARALVRGMTLHLNATKPPEG